MNVLVSAAVVAAVLGALSGGFVGYFTRSAEYRRDQRLKIYAEFMTAFRDHVVAGARMYSVSVTYGLPHEGAVTTQKQSAFNEATDNYNPSAAAFNEATAKLRLVGSDPVLRVADEMESYVRSNVYSALPFAFDLKKAGAEAKVGPAKVTDGIGLLVSRFAGVARADIAEPRVLRRRR